MAARNSDAGEEENGEDGGRKTPTSIEEEVARMAARKSGADEEENRENTDLVIDGDGEYGGEGGGADSTER